MQLSIVIPVKNDQQGLERCLRSISSASSPPPYEVIVVDNGSTDNSVAVAESFGARVLEAPEGSVSALRNLGAAEAAGRYLAFLDADCSVSTEWFESIADYLSEGDVICFGSPPVVPDRSTWVQRCWYQIRRRRLYARKVFEVEWLESMNLFVRREDFLKLAGFDEEMITCEDVDLCKRLSALAPVICDNRVVATHHGEARTVRHFYLKERWRGTSNWQSLRKHGFDKAELPSVVFPIAHLALLLLTAIAGVLTLYNVIPLMAVGVLLLLWQVPLLLLSLSKNEAPVRAGVVIGLWALLNLYFFARAVSLFSHAPWVDPQKNQLGSEATL
jgi:glycosyltransferase involved in cell wall biosynthesis